MTDLRVPTVALDAEIVCADGTWFVGRIFLPAASSSHTGPMRPVEWMNDASTSFFPFLPANAPGSVILNKAEVVVLTVLGETEPDEEGVDTPHRRVQIECRERVVAGTVYIDMPEGHQRVLDYLNRPEPFVIVRDGGRHHLVRKTRITRVTEPAEA